MKQLSLSKHYSPLANYYLKYYRGVARPNMMQLNADRGGVKNPEKHMSYVHAPLRYFFTKEEIKSSMLRPLNAVRMI